MRSAFGGRSDCSQLTECQVLRPRVRLEHSFFSLGRVLTPSSVAASCTHPLDVTKVYVPHSRDAALTFTAIFFQSYANTGVSRWCKSTVNPQRHPVLDSDIWDSKPLFWPHGISHEANVLLPRTPRVVREDEGTFFKRWQEAENLGVAYRCKCSRWPGRCRW